ncbi:MAG TPA: FAD:protein FMN transferase [Chthoniobacterales bacterium]|nr:FAD:protein FMN transferase [Chthoniobacterales bacterium]
MKLPSNTEVRRARPLLGTIVDIACAGSSADVDRAFCTVEQVQRLMSFHDRASDISRINRDGFRQRVIVHPWTWRVLKTAQELSHQSEDAFDITVASKVHGAGWRDIVLEKNRAVRLQRRVLIDLGGIAKGFAVDRAVDALHRDGVTRGIVNAGGDIRVFGPTARAVHLRHPSSPVLPAGVLRVANRAIATSATYFAPRALIDARTRRPLIDFVSVTVAADNCMIADALTKIVFTLRERSAPLLKHYHANALLLERDGSASWMAQCDTRD